MKSLRALGVAALLAAASFALVSPASAGILVSSAVDGNPLPFAGNQYENFNNCAGQMTFCTTASGITAVFIPDAQGITGSTTNINAAPYIAGNDALFGGTGTYFGPDQTAYLTTGIGQVGLTFPDPVQYIGFLLGSVDAYNSISLYDMSNALIGTITGSDISAAPNGDQGIFGTNYVNLLITGTAAKRAVFSSSQYAAEFDNVAFSTYNVPEPLTLSLFGAGLVGIGALRRRRKTSGAAPARMAAS